MVGHNVRHELKSEKVKDNTTGERASLMDFASIVEEDSQLVLNHPAASLIKGKLIDLLADVELFV